MIERFHLLGLGPGVVAGGADPAAEGFGWADIAAKKPYTPDSRHRIGSITKDDDWPLHHGARG
jgi:CubicO group peptidase (beta-lactamase class C family)